MWIISEHAEMKYMVVVDVYNTLILAEIYRAGLGTPAVPKHVLSLSPLVS
jgi:hypothetical protein